MKIRIIALISLVCSLGSYPVFSEDKPNVEDKPNIFEKITPPSNLEAHAELKNTVSDYFKSWQNKDFKAMLTYENWEGGSPLDEIGYLKAIDTDFTIHQWQVTQIHPSKDGGEYKVLILVTHNPPKQVAALLPPGKTVRSTLSQWWKQEGDKYVHLFNVERDRLLKPMEQPPAGNPFKGLPKPAPEEDTPKEEAPAKEGAPSAS